MIKLIIFDMDGTILDSAVDILNSLNHTLIKYDEKEITLKRCMKTLGYGAKYLVEKNLGKNHFKQEILNDYLEYYNNHLIVKSKPYPNVINTLKYLKELGIIITVASNKSDKMVNSISKDLFLDLFDFSIGETPLIKKKPNPDMIDHTLEKFNIKKNECLYIGDTEVDYQTALNSNIKFVGCSYGFRSKYLLKKLGEFVIIDDISKLINIVERSFKNE